MGLLLFVAAGHALLTYVIKSPSLLDDFDFVGRLLLSLYFAALVVGTLAELTAILAVRWIMFTIGVAAFFVAGAIGNVAGPSDRLLEDLRDVVGIRQTARSQTRQDGLELIRLEPDQAEWWRNSASR